MPTPMLPLNKRFLATPSPIGPVFRIGIPAKIFSNYGIILDFSSYAWTWGSNTSGRLGDNTTTNRSSPVSVVGGRQWRYIGGGTATRALDLSSYAWAWGLNSSGQIGDNTVSTRLSPVSVVGGRQWLVLAAGEVHNVALDSLSYAWCWGANAQGLCADNTAADRSSPVSVVGGRQWLVIAPGSPHTIALDALSYAWGWGNNDGAQLGDNTVTRRSSPVSVVGGKQFIKVSTGGTTASAGHSVALDGLSYAWAWGAGSDGQLGDNTATQRASPVSVVGGLQFVDISAGRNFTMAIDGSGRIWGWGRNGTGQVGDNTVTQRNSPVTLAFIPGATRFKQVTANNGTAAGTTTGHVLALDVDDNLWSWGNNTSGELGFINNVTNTSSPVFNPQRGPSSILNPLGKL